jgi:hypothetical protein
MQGKLDGLLAIGEGMQALWHGCVNGEGDKNGRT